MAISCRGVRYTTGECALHDMVFDGSSILAVNTAYSCICRIDGIHNFVPVWQPPWISAIPGRADRCHLNGMAVENGDICYATALGTTNVPRGWTERRLDGGVLMEVPSGTHRCGWPVHAAFATADRRAALHHRCRHPAR